MINLPKEPSDPVLKAAMEEIKAVLTKHDIGGVAILQSKTHGEWLNEVCPSWACTKLEKHGDKELLRIKALLKDYPSKEAHQETLRLTVSMIFGFKDGAERIAQNMEALLRLLNTEGGMDIEHVSRFDH